VENFGGGWGRHAYLLPEEACHGRRPSPGVVVLRGAHWGRRPGYRPKAVPQRQWPPCGRRDRRSSTDARAQHPIAAEQSLDPYGR
jgi:hypothetical protein